MWINWTRDEFFCIFLWKLKIETRKTNWSFVFYPKVWIKEKITNKFSFGHGISNSKENKSTQNNICIFTVVYEKIYLILSHGLYDKNKYKSYWENVRYTILI